jgi:hypothetical protein
MSENVKSAAMATAMARIFLGTIFLSLFISFSIHAMRRALAFTADQPNRRL